MKFRPFAEAKDYVHSLGLRSEKEWRKYCKSGKKPQDIPQKPYRTYKKEWKGMGDWLGTGRIADQKRKFKPFEEAREFVHSLKLHNEDEWRRYCKSGQKPADIPYKPSRTYENEWKGMGDWLGTGYIAPGLRKFRPFEEAREFVHTLKLKSREEWEQYCKSGKKPDDIPYKPSRTYENEWIRWGDWLGTGRIADQKRRFRPFEEAREFIHSLGLQSETEWRKYCKSGKKPQDIPQKPYRTYKREWTTWGDWLGTGRIANQVSGWSAEKVKGLLRALIETRTIYQWDEAVLYSLLLRKGVLDLSSNRHTKFFKNLIEASRTEQGRKAIEEYANSDSEVPPDLSELTHLNTEDKEEVQTASSQEIAQIVGNEDQLDYGQIKTAKQILANTSFLESINVDEEAMQFYLDYSIDELWKSAFRYGEEKAIITAKRNGNRYHDTVVDTFLSDYKGTQDIKSKLPDSYSFPHRPTLMQLYVAHKIKTNSYFGNFSGTGAGKTLSAVLASRVIDSKMTVIVCPNDVVNQWEKNILEIFPDSKVITGKKHFIQNTIILGINTLF